MRRDGATVWRLLSARAATFAFVAFLALGAFSALLIVTGRNPWQAYADTIVYVFGNAYGFSELLVRMTPLLFTAVAAALPARIGLINVGGEGQLYMGAWLATAGELALQNHSALVVLPALTVLGFVGGGLWALLPAILRALRLVNETISTLLLNYVAPLIVSYFIFGPWRSPESSSYPQSPAFVDAARLPTFFHSRVHAGLLYALVCLVLYWLALSRTRFGLEMRAIGGNPEAARRLGIPVFRYIADGDVHCRRGRRPCRNGRSVGDSGPLGVGTVAGLRLHRISCIVARRHHRQAASWPCRFFSPCSARSATCCRSPKVCPTRSSIY